MSYMRRISAEDNAYARRPVPAPDARLRRCARARAAGAAIVREPNDEFYGDRVYSARDPEGHVWTFSQQVRIASRAEAEKASGLTIDSPAWE